MEGNTGRYRTPRIDPQSRVYLDELFDRGGLSRPVFSFRTLLIGLAERG